MRWLAFHMRWLLCEEDGPSAVEYAVMLSLMFSMCLAAITVLGSNVVSLFSNVANSLQTVFSHSFFHLVG